MHIEFLKNHPELATLEFSAMSKVTGKMETCTDHPTIRYANGTVIDGIPDIDRMVIFGCCRHGSKVQFRCGCEEHSMCGKMTFEQHISELDECKPDHDDDDRLRTERKATMHLIRRFHEIKLREQKRQEIIDRENRVLQLSAKYNDISQNKVFNNKEGLDIRKEDDCLVEFYMTFLVDAIKENRVTLGKRYRKY